MTGAELSAALSELGLSRAGFAALCGVERETVYRWLRGKGVKGALPVPQYVVTIIHLMRQQRAA